MVVLLDETCKTEQEYIFSKELLIIWLDSVTLRDSIGEDMAAIIKYFLDVYVFTHKS